MQRHRLGGLVDDKQIEPHIPVWDKSERDDGTLSRSEFQYDAARDRYECPAGKYLHTTGRAPVDGTVLYRSKNLECAVCPLKPRCCPNTSNRKIAPSIHESTREVARALAKTDAYRRSRKDRKKAEILFAHLKRVLKLDRLRLQGRSGVRDEFLLYSRDRTEPATNGEVVDPCSSRGAPASRMKRTANEKTRPFHADARFEEPESSHRRLPHHHGVLQQIRPEADVDNPTYSPPFG